MATGNRLIRVSFVAFLLLATVATLRISSSSFPLVHSELLELLVVKDPEATTAITAATIRSIPYTPPTTLSSSPTNRTSVSSTQSPLIVHFEGGEPSSNVTNTNDNNSDNNKFFNKTLALEYLLSKLPVNYHSKLVPSIQAAVEPLWTCRDSSPEKKAWNKLGFVHVFKTAGSTMRSFFHSYAKQCRARSYATLTTCTDVKYQTLLHSSSSSSSSSGGDWNPCLLKDATQNGNYRVWNRYPVPPNELHRFDILGGHYRLGLLDHLSSSTRKNAKGTVVVRPNPNVRTIIFFRNAAVKYVSGKVYIKNRNILMYNQDPKNKNKKKKGPLQFEDVVRSIQEEMKNARRHRHFHSKYATYLLTPQQYQQAKNWTMSYQVQVMKQNLIDYNVTIGMVEDMSRSMELIQQLIDPLHEVDHFFGRYQSDGSSGGGGGTDGTDATSNAAATTTNATTTRKTATSSHRSKNISPLSSSLILATLQATDRATYEQILHFVKREQEITDFAMALQQVQYETMHDLYGNTHQNM